MLSTSEWCNNYGENGLPEAADHEHPHEEKQHSVVTGLYAEKQYIDGTVLHLCVYAASAALLLSPTGPHINISIPSSIPHPRRRRQALGRAAAAVAASAPAGRRTLRERSR